MKQKLSPKFWCALTLFSLIGQIAWVIENMYFNVFIYKMFNASAADISAMVAASAVAATLTTVFMGALSDRIGKRKLFICAGYILWGISILSFVFIRLDVIEALFPAAVSAASLGVSLVIILDCVMTFFGSSANDAAFNAWLTDSVDSKRRGAAEGINAMMPLVAILAVFGGFMAFDLNSSSSWSVIFAIIGILVTAIGIVGLFIIDEPKLSPSKSGYFKNVIYGFLPSTVRSNPALYISLLCFIIFNISIQIFMPYLIIYYEVSLGMSDYVFVMAPAIIIASGVTAIWGKVYDKKGFTLSSFISLAWLCAGFVILYLTRSTLPVFIGSLLMMCGYLAGMAVFGAKIRDLIPCGKAGMFQGVRIFSQVLIPGIVGPFIGKSVLDDTKTIVGNDGTTSFVPTADIFLAALIAALVAVIILIFISKLQKPRLQKELKTPFEDSSALSWAEEYPRPQMKRDSYLSLCGEWELSLKRNDKENTLGSIRVPFSPESRLSGTQRELRRGELYLYKKTFSLPDGFAAQKVMINFGAVDQKARVFLNGNLIGEHVGGYLPFSLELTNSLISGENTLIVEVEDSNDTELPYGKQRKKRGGMWYTPISGIWQPVWLESVPQNHITSLRITPSLDCVTIDTVGGEAEKLITVKLPNGICERRYSGDSITLKIEDPILWTPDNPYLYEFTLSSGKDKISSYFALRTVSIVSANQKSYIALNGKPLFCHGLLDQGYFSDGIYLPATPEGYLFDILNTKALGFNMLRKHIKIEPDLFYYYCDKHGMLVFQDMVNSGKYSFLIDTALPTVGMKKGVRHRASKLRREAFERDAVKTVETLYNHPSVVYYTIFNEGWGQYDADRLYDELKALDGTRVWDSTSGWFAEKKSDVVSEHVYFKKINLSARHDRPLVLSEFGGYSCKIHDHSFNLDKTYGYRFFNTKDSFMSALEALYRDEIVPAITESGLSAAVLTQVSDVEDETNGLFTYDRQVNKTDGERMRILAEELYRSFENSL